jgi:threonine/homoserine/homoserine lactone efflux protein
MIKYLLVGVLAGIVISLPVGGAAVMCIRKTLKDGLKTGYISSLGASFADMIFAGIAAVGVSILSEYIAEYRSPFEIGSAFVVIFFGILFFFRREKYRKNQKYNKYITRARGVFASFAISITNPVLVVILLAFFTKTGLTFDEGGVLPHFTAILGLAAGSTIMYWLTAFFTYRNKKQISDVLPGNTNRIFGIILSSLGVLILIKHFLPPINHIFH